MTRKRDRDIVTALDIGTSKVAAIVAAADEESGELEILGFGSSPSKGMKRGSVVNIEATIKSIDQAVGEAELMSGVQIGDVVVGISGDHVQSLTSHGIVAVGGEEVSESDVARVIEAARAVLVPSDKRVLHVLPRDYVVDDQDGILDPTMMSGVRLEAHVHIITVGESAAQNIEKCVRRCNLRAERIVLEHLASGTAILTDDEMQLGCCVLDIGAGTTDIAVFQGGSIRFTHVIPIAGDQVTHDIAQSLRTPTQAAEQLKIHYACALAQMVEENEEIEVLSVGDRPPRKLARQALARVVEPRYEELFQLVHNVLHRGAYLESAAAGVVLTGGTSAMPGAVELAEEVLNVPVRLGHAQRTRGLQEVVSNPAHATGVGLLLYALKPRDGQAASGGRPKSGGLRSAINWLKGQF
ncbi:cell division protein FtsA [Candidatus Foliamicus sp.]